MNKEEILDLYKEAQGSWTGWDWRMDFEADGTTEFLECRGDIDPESPVAERATAYAIKCEECAAEAEHQAKLAIDAVLTDQMSDAVSFSERASELESQFGDDPTWGNFRRAVAKMDEQIKETN